MKRAAETQEDEARRNVRARMDDAGAVDTGAAPESDVRAVIKKISRPASVPFWTDLDRAMNSARFQCLIALPRATGFVEAVKFADKCGTTGIDCSRAYSTPEDDSGKKDDDPLMIFLQRCEHCSDSDILMRLLTFILDTGGRSNLNRRTTGGTYRPFDRAGFISHKTQNWTILELLLNEPTLELHDSSYESSARYLSYFRVPQEFLRRVFIRWADEILGFPTAHILTSYPVRYCFFLSRFVL